MRRRHRRRSPAASLLPAVSLLPAASPLPAAPLLAAALLAAALLAAGCTADDPNELVIAVPPGRIADLETTFAPLFEAAHGVRIVPVGLRSADQAARVRVERGNPSLDALWIDAGEAALLAREGLLAGAEGDPAGEGEAPRLPNLEAVDPAARFSDGALPATFASAIGFLHNTEALPEPPASWAALAHPELRGRLALFGFGSTLGPLTVAALARISGRGESDADAGFAALARIRPNVRLFGTSGPAANQLVAQGEAWLTLGLPSQALHLAASGAPVGWAAPAEGALALPQGIQITAGTRRPELARAFADFMFSPEAQEAAANALLMVPSRMDVPLPEGLPRPDQLLRFDMAALGERRAAWAARFRGEVLPE